MSLILDGTAGLTFNNASTQNSGGKVLQVVNAIYQTQASTASLTAIDTGLTASITPLFATSKILVMVDQGGLYVTSGGGTQGGNLILLKNGSNIATIAGRYGGDAGTATTMSVASASIGYLDSPATTSTITYKTQYYSGNGQTVYVQVYSSASTITLMEIAA
jgi:hypothetical protein